MALKVYVCRGVVEKNAAEGANDPPIRVLDTETGKSVMVHSIAFKGDVRVNYDRAAPEGERVWIEMESASFCRTRS